MNQKINEIILEKYIDDELSYEKANELLTSFISLNNDGYIEEGANKEYINAFKEANKKFKISFKKLKKIASSGNPELEDEFIKELEIANKSLDEGVTAISDIPSSAISSVLSFIILDITQFCKWIIPTILTFGLAAFVSFFQSLTIFLKGVVKGVKGEEDWAEALNLVRQKYLRICEYNRKLLTMLQKKYNKNMEKQVAKNEKKNKKNNNKE